MLLKRLDADQSLGTVPRRANRTSILSELLARLSALTAPERLRRQAAIGTDSNEFRLRLFG